MDELVRVDFEGLREALPKRGPSDRPRSVLEGVRSTAGCDTGPEMLQLRGQSLMTSRNKGMHRRPQGGGKGAAYPLL